MAGAMGRVHVAGGEGAQGGEDGLHSGRGRRAGALLRASQEAPHHTPEPLGRAGGRAWAGRSEAAAAEAVGRVEGFLWSCEQGTTVRQYMKGREEDVLSMLARLRRSRLFVPVV